MGGKLPPPKRKRKERERGGEREREREKGGGGKSVLCFGATIYLITLKLAEYHRLKTITPQCHKNTKFNDIIKLMVIGYQYSTWCVKLPRPLPSQTEISR